MKRGIFIIAEAGVNHNGSLALAKKLALAAKKAGADAVKFQTFKAELLSAPSAPKAGYQAKATGAADSQLAMLKKLELTRTAHFQLKNYCGKIGLDFLSSPFDLDSVEFLLKMGLKTIKIPSGEITNLPLLRRIGISGRKVIISTGMAQLSEVAAALKVLYAAGVAKRDITLLHCNTEYPTPMRDVNLKAMAAMGRKFGLSFGYSDHTEGITVPVAAAALGAEIIEKHLTLDKKMNGPDHKASLELSEFKAMVEAVRAVELALGTGVKKPSPSEIKNMPVARKSITAVFSIAKGARFTADNIAAMRPGGGLSPMLWDRVIGKRARRAFNSGEKIRL
ncbi:MAG: N-acetylneuraminate synthase [Elusimicrobia bacterium GWA2_56_46]|nr:MAG: N-acetylneuraminate synthase [Elusimicrobia bacterium GWA2_56_46]OGR55464.1 MAG: N-acetylneuraminate synthase [Elusimicrobia bacterium GWC2_56_31]HBW21932.1 N-acetylneuraminate synthase [Elusimicrobiota bacterium]